MELLVEGEDDGFLLLKVDRGKFSCIECDGEIARRFNPGDFTLYTLRRELSRLSKYVKRVIIFGKVLAFSEVVNGKGRKMKSALKRIPISGDDGTVELKFTLKRGFFSSKTITATVNLKRSVASLSGIIYNLKDKKEFDLFVKRLVEVAGQSKEVLVRSGKFKARTTDVVTTVFAMIEHSLKREYQRPR